MVITRPDKGNGVVLLNKTDYLEKVSSVLQDTSKFQKVDGDPLKIIFKLEDKINRFLQTTFGINSNGRRDSTYYNLYVSGSNLGILYGLPKIHKKDCPMRPILSACNTPGYGLAKYLVPILSPITTNKYTIKDSFSFAKELINTPAKGTVMASFDVKSLFTNIPLNETIDIISYEMFENPENESNVELSETGEKLLKCPVQDHPDEFYFYTKDTFRKLVELATLDSYFFFNGDIFQQVDGVAMGSPLGPTLANIFMNHMEKKWLQSCPLDFKPTLYRRYVDDTFLLFKDVQHVSLFLTYLNSQHPNISFTSEIEENGSLPFLDIQISCNDTNFVTSIYRKPTFTGLMSKFNDFAPTEYKSNLISTLICRAYRISSDYVFFNSEVDFLKKLLQSNGYTLDFIERHIGRMLNKLLQRSSKETPLNYDVPKPIVYFTTYFLGDVSKNMAKEMRSLIQSSYPQVHLRILYKSCNTIGSHFSFKDKTPREIMSNLN